MIKKVLITGGSGLLALNWALSMQDRCSIILGLHKRNISLAGIESQQIDLESVDQLARVFETVEPQLVIHTAGLTSVEKCEVNPELAQHINVDLAENVAKACVKLGLPLAHISTDHLFSGEASFVDETCPIEPINVYGRTKGEAESRVLDINPVALVIRTNFYGWGTSYRRSFSDEIIQTLRSGHKMTLFKDVFYTPILVETAAQAVHDLINLKASGIFHIVGDERVSKYEFGRKLEQEFNLDPSMIKPGNIAGNSSLVKRPKDMSLSNQKACKLLDRKLGGVGEHIAKLHYQEQNGVAQELQKL